jgi:hypothetical protein
MSTFHNLDHEDLVYRGAVAASASANNPTTGDGRLVLPIWAGEVIHAYDQYNVFEGLVDSKTISSGTSMEFPVTGYVNLQAAWNAGVELNGGTESKADSFRIALDKRPMAAHFEIDNIDMMLTQWEFRSELAKQAGRTLSDARDRQLAAYIARAAAEDGLANDPRATDWIGNSAVGGLGGKVFCNSNFDNLGLSTATAANRTTAALKLLEKIEEFQIRLQEVDAPTEGVFCAVSPRAFQDIRALGVARDSSDLAGGAGRPFFGGVADAGGLGAGLQQGMFNLADRLEYQGCTIIKTNHLPTMNYGASNIGEARYNRTFHAAPVKALIWQQACVASLRLMGMKVDQVDDVRRNTVFTVASMLGGTGVLKPEHAAVCIGRPGNDHQVANGNSYRGETNNDEVFKGTATGGLLSNGSTAITNLIFGQFAFDATTGDITAYDIDPAGSPTTIDCTTTATGIHTSADALIRDMYQASLGASTLNIGDDADESDDAVSGTSAMVLEYQSAGDIALMPAAATGGDGLGTAQD